MSRTTVRCKFVPGAKAAPGRPVRKAVRPTKPGPSRAARMLALAHYVERLVGDGELSGYADAAEALGLTRARVTQVMNLLMLAPQIQEAILVGDLPASERSLRSVVKELAWSMQAEEKREEEDGT